MSLHLCDYGHDEVCYEVRECPVCLVIKERDAMEEKLRGEIESLQEDIEVLKEAP